MPKNRQANRLIHEKSPYLLQHAHNPVDWFPWCDEAFQKAKSEDKPLFLSIGYSTCHWCHVMERESFEDKEVAEILNRHFVSIKVDREERPDIDHIYMQVCQAITGHGGWPLTVFLTPDRIPFYAGTYFPKNDRMGMPGLLTLLEKISEIWRTDKDSLIKSGNRIIQALNAANDSNNAENGSNEAEISHDIIHEAYNELKYSFDPVYGGFGTAPKFPMPHTLLFLLRYWYSTRDDPALDMVEKTLDCMRKGGIYDHIGFGFSRYSTDDKWLIPHFEKMLYDNALLAMAYLEAYQATGKNEYAETAQQIFTYVLRDMTSPEGGFYSAEDADSEGVEGKFYRWTPEEVIQVLGKEHGEKFCEYFDITGKGNFEGYSIPNLVKSGRGNGQSEIDYEFIDKCRKKLFEHREKRIHPHKDDKILTSWNGLMIASMAIGSRILGKESYLKAAEKAAEFIFSKLFDSKGRLLARYRDGEAAYRAYADDYAFMIWGLIELYETSFKPIHLKRALKLNEDLLEYFWDNENGGLFFYGKDSEQLIARPKEAYDGAMPSGNSVAALNFLRLARLTGRHELEDLLQKQLRAFGNSIMRAPSGHLFMLSALLFSLSKAKEVVLVRGTDPQSAAEMLKAVREHFMPFTHVVYISDEHRELQDISPYTTVYRPVDGKTTAYVCENYSCQAPVTDAVVLKNMLQ